MLLNTLESTDMSSLATSLTVGIIGTLFCTQDFICCISSVWVQASALSATSWGSSTDAVDWISADFDYSDDSSFASSIIVGCFSVSMTIYVSIFSFRSSILVFDILNLNSSLLITTCNFSHSDSAFWRASFSFWSSSITCSYLSNRFPTHFPIDFRSFDIIFMSLASISFSDLFASSCLLQRLYYIRLITWRKGYLWSIRKLETSSTKSFLLLVSASLSWSLFTTINWRGLASGCGFINMIFIIFFILFSFLSFSLSLYSSSYISSLIGR